MPSTRTGKHAERPQGYLRFRGSRGTDRAAAEHGEVARVDGEPEAITGTFGEGSEDVLGRFDHGATGLAHEVPVGLRREVVGGGAVTEVGVHDDSETFQLIEVAVDGREVHIWCQELHLGGELLSGSVGGVLKEAAEQEASRCRHATTLGPQKSQHRLDRAALRPAGWRLSGANHTASILPLSIAARPLVQLVRTASACRAAGSTSRDGRTSIEQDRTMFVRAHLEELLERERSSYRDLHARSFELSQSPSNLLSGVPMTWMAKWYGGFPLVLTGARGATVTDVDGHDYADFCLGDTGAMAGHSPPATVAAIRRRVEEEGGLTTMLPSADAAAVGAELASRFGISQWSFTLTATDANRWAIRIARHLTGRRRILVFNHCYHGSVDETVVTLEGGEVRPSPGSVGPPVEPAMTTRVAEFNDLAAIEAELAMGDVSAVLTEPALTNIGIVLPEPGFHEGLRALTRASGSLLIIDETHTFSAGPGGCTQAWQLEPDVVTVGKAIGGGIPAGAYGLSAELADRLLTSPDTDLVDVGGVGGTLAGNALSTAAMRATLEEVLTEAAFARMIALAERYETGARQVLATTGLAWTISRLGARAEYRFCPEPPRTGAESAAAADDDLDEFFHIYLANRNVLLTPFHNMALMCPATTDGDVDRLLAGFSRAAGELVGASSS
jgi:glutamate-1-semialdehyde 2,1-aminomutase